MPRRAGERGALDAGALRQPAARVAGRSPTPRRAPRSSRPGALADPGDTAGRAAAARHRAEIARAPPRLGELDGRWWSAGSTRYDLPDPGRRAGGALASAGFLVSLEMHALAPSPSSPTWCSRSRRTPQKSGSLPELGGPAAAVRAGAGRQRRAARLPGARHPGVEMDVDLFTQTPAAAAAEMARLGRHVGVAPRRPAGRARPSRVRPEFFGQAVLATWRQLHRRVVAGRRRAAPGGHGPAGARCGCQPAPRRSAWACADGRPGTVRTERGAITLPVAVADMPDGVVWLPGELRRHRQVRAGSGVGHGDLVGVTA